MERQIKKTATSFLMVFLLAFLMGNAQQLKAQNSADFGIWMDAGVEKKFNKQWSLEGEIGARTRNDSKEMDRYHLGIATDYKLNKYLKFSAGYNLLYDHRGGTQTYHKDGTVNKITPSYWWPRHRFSFGVTGSYSFGNLGVSLREMYQYTYRSKAKDKKYDTDTEEWEDVKSKSQHLLRSRFQLNYRLKHTPFTPFGSVELFHGEGVLQKTRYTLGTSYSISKQHKLKLYYRYQDLRQNDDDDPDTHVLGIGYSYQF